MTGPAFIGDPFIMGSYAVAVGGVIGGVLICWLRMRRAERERGR